MVEMVDGWRRWMVEMVDDRWLRQQHATELGSTICQPYSTVRGVWEPK